MCDNKCIELDSSIMVGVQIFLPEILDLYSGELAYFVSLEFWDPRKIFAIPQ
jgi:hypothetical protein